MTLQFFAVLPVNITFTLVLTAMMMMISCFCEIVDRGKVLALFRAGITFKYPRHR